MLCTHLTKLTLVRFTDFFDGKVWSFVAHFVNIQCCNIVVWIAHIFGIHYKFIRSCHSTRYTICMFLSGLEVGDQFSNDFPFIRSTAVQRELRVFFPFSTQLYEYYMQVQVSEVEFFLLYSGFLATVEFLVIWSSASTPPLMFLYKWTISGFATRGSVVWVCFDEIEATGFLFMRSSMIPMSWMSQIHAWLKWLLILSQRIFRVAWRDCSIWLSLCSTFTFCCSKDS